MSVAFQVSLYHRVNTFINYLFNKSITWFIVIIRGVPCLSGNTLSILYKAVL